MRETAAREETVLTLYDLTTLVKRRWGVILTSAILFGAFGFLFPLTKSISYLAEATFLDKEAQSVGGNEGLMSLVTGGGGALQVKR